MLGVQRGMLDGTSRRGRVSGCPGHVQGHGDDQLPRRKSLRRRSRVAPVSLLALRSLGGFPGLMAERRKGSVSPEVQSPHLEQSCSPTGACVLCARTWNGVAVV